MATYYNMEYEREEEIDGWQLDLVDENGEVIVVEHEHYLMVDKPGGIKETSMWIPEIYKRFYDLFFNNGLEEMNNQRAGSYYHVIKSVVEHLGHVAHSEYLRSTAGNAGRALLDFTHLINLADWHCSINNQDESKIRVSKTTKTAIYNEHGVFCRWG